jgi:hypothetical protein
MTSVFHSPSQPDFSDLAPRADPTFTGSAAFASLNVSGTASFGSGLTVDAFPSVVAAAQMDSGTALTLPPSSAVLRVRLTGNATLTLPAMPALPANARTTLEVELVQDGTGGRTVAWAAGSGDTIEWDYSAVAPAIAAAAAKETHFVFRRRAGSTSWYAAKIWQGV